MNYYYDTEFLEGTQKTWTGKTLSPTIDLISIGIVSEDNREYYAISKDFNLNEAWNRYDIKHMSPLGGIGDSNNDMKIYWIRENVLFPIYNELLHKYVSEGNLPSKKRWDYKEFKFLINKYGKTNKQISEEVKEFCKPIEGEPMMWNKSGHEIVNIGRENTYTNPTFGVEYIGRRTPPIFYGYYSAYDHVVLCWLFGKMIDLPAGFPMYTRDLKQLKDEIIERAYNRAHNDFEKKLILDMDSMKDYPKQTNVHNALADARWNKELHKFLNQF